MRVWPIKPSEFRSKLDLILVDEDGEEIQRAGYKKHTVRATHNRISARFGPAEEDWGRIRLAARTRLGYLRVISESPVRIDRGDVFRYTLDRGIGFK